MRADPSEADLTQISITSLRQKILTKEISIRIPTEIAKTRRNLSPGRNTYLATNDENIQRQLDQLESLDHVPLAGVPISIKDCFDVAGYPTSSGSRFYQEQSGIRTADSAVAQQVRSAGGIVTGKTHLNQLAYGLTGENQDFGNCLQPANPTLLTGGSSSGAAASVLEGSAMCAIGTDTGGSIRFPASLCGLYGFRASLGVVSAHALYHRLGILQPRARLRPPQRVAPRLWFMVFPLASAARVAGCSVVGVVLGRDRNHQWYCSSVVVAARGRLHAGSRYGAHPALAGRLSRASVAPRGT